MVHPEMQESPRNDDDQVARGPYMRAISGQEMPRSPLGEKKRRGRGGRGRRGGGGRRGGTKTTKRERRETKERRGRKERRKTQKNEEGEGGRAWGKGGEKKNAQNAVNSQPYESKRLELRRALVRPQNAANCSTLREQTAGSPPHTSQASACSELLNPMRANCWIPPAHQPGL